MSRTRYVKKACEIGDNIFRKLLKNFRTFKTEKDIYDFILNEIKKVKCRPSFRPIIAAGRNAAEIHHQAKQSGLKKGFLVIDWGVRYKGYCSDCTRTIYIGKPSKKEKQFYNLVKDVQLTCLTCSLPETSCSDLDAIARAGFGKYMKYFRHGLGHGVGKRIHCRPSIKPNSRDIVKKGQTLTIEPGLYFKNKFGIRIEDTVLIKQRPVVLTKIKKKLITI